MSSSREPRRGRYKITVRQSLHRELFTQLQGHAAATQRRMFVDRVVGAAKYAALLQKIDESHPELLVLRAPVRRDKLSPRVALAHEKPILVRISWDVDVLVEPFIHGLLVHLGNEGRGQMLLRLAAREDVLAQMLLGARAEPAVAEAKMDLPTDKGMASSPWRRGNIAWGSAPSVDS